MRAKKGENINFGEGPENLWLFHHLMNSRSKCVKFLLNDQVEKYVFDSTEIAAFVFV